MLLFSAWFLPVSDHLFFLQNSFCYWFSFSAWNFFVSDILFSFESFCFWSSFFCLNSFCFLSFSAWNSVCFWSSFSGCVLSVSHLIFCSNYFFLVCFFLFMLLFFCLILFVSDLLLFLYFISSCFRSSFFLTKFWFSFSAWIFFVSDHFFWLRSSCFWYSFSAWNYFYFWSSFSAWNLPVSDVPFLLEILISLFLISFFLINPATKCYFKIKPFPSRCPL